LKLTENTKQNNRLSPAFPSHPHHARHPLRPAHYHVPEGRWRYKDDVRRRRSHRCWR